MSDDEVTRSDDKPHNRASRLAEIALNAIRDSDEYRGESVMVFLDTGTHGAIGIAGYEDDIAAMANLLMHLRAMFRVQGKDLQFHPYPLGRG